MNNDNEINVLDVIVLINIIFDNINYLDNADMNNDANINIFDIIILIELILTN